MQHLVIFEAEPRGLPLGERLLPEYLRAQGYRTHAVGKWHLGFYRREYTPTFRGFDSHYGYYQGFQDYYDHSVRATVSDTNLSRKPSKNRFTLNTNITNLKRQRVNSDCYL